MAESQHILELPYSIKYETDRDVPLRDVIKALESLEKLLGNSSSALSQATGVEIHGQEILVNRVEAGSLLEEIALKLFFKDEEDLQKATAWIRENVKVKNLLVGALIGAALSYGYNVLHNSNAANPPNGNNNNTISNSENSNIFNIHSDVLNDEAKQAINQAVVKTLDKNVAARQTLNFIEPIRADSAASITFGKGQAITDSLDFEEINTIPESYKPIKNNIFDELKNEVIHIRATDLDSKKTGWAGSVEGKTERLKIVLDPTLDPDEIYGRKSFRADITLERNFNKSENQYIPSRIIIRHVYPRVENK